MGSVVAERTDRKSTRLNSSHLVISYAVFCLKKKKKAAMTNPTPRYFNAQVTRNNRQHILALPRCLTASVHLYVFPRDQYVFFFFFLNDTAPPEIYPLSLHDPLPICDGKFPTCRCGVRERQVGNLPPRSIDNS